MSSFAVTQAILFAGLQHSEDLEKLRCFYDEKNIVNLKQNCKLCNKKMISNLIVCPWCYNATHKECIDKLFQTNEKMCPYCTSTCFKHYNSN